MRVAFAQPGTGNADKLGVLDQFIDCFRTAVAHTCTQATNQLEDDVGEWTFVRYTAFDAFWYELVFYLDSFLEIAVPRTMHP